MKFHLSIFLFLLLSSKGYSQLCTLNVAMSQSAQSICSGNKVTITATASGGTAPFTYTWSTGEITPSIFVNKAGTYTVSVSDKTPGCQPVKQSVTVSESATPNAPTGVGSFVCPNSSATLKAVAPGGNYQWYDQPVGGNFLGSGATYTTPPITTTTPFYVETSIAGCTSARTAVYAVLNANPVVKGATVCVGNAATLSVSPADSYTWYDAPGGNVVGSGQTFTTPFLNTTTTYYVVVTANGCTSAATAVTAVVSPPPQAPLASNVSVCSGFSANLTANSPAGIINWFDVPAGGLPIISSPDYTTPPLTTTTTYYAETSLNGCESSRTPVTVTVLPAPQAPAAQTVNVCYGTSATLIASAAPTGTYEWYDAAIAGNKLATGVNFNTPVLTNSVTYYVLANNGSCISQRTAIKVNIIQQLPAPSASGSIICSGTATTLSATGTGGTFNWYNAPAGGALLATGATYTTPQLTANTTYYVQETLSGCTSPMAAVTVSVLPAVTPPTAANTTACSGTSAVLSASGPNNSYAWYDSAVGGNLLSSAQVYVTPAITATTTYYVETSANGCASARTPVTVTVSPLPASPTVTGTSVCPGMAANLTAAASGTIQWYNAATGGTLLTTGNTFTTPVLTVSTTYYVQNTAGTCTSIRTPVTVTVFSVNNPQFQYPSGSFCATGPNPTPQVNNIAGGTFSAAPAGLVFVSNTTGEINIAASTPGNYVVSFSSNGACANVTTAKISIITTSSASFSYNGPYCQDGVNPLPTFPGAGTGGTFSAFPAGLIFVNSSTGEIDLTASQPGAYTITNAINTSGGCPANVGTSTVTIAPRTIVSAGPPQTINTGSTAQLAGTISGGSTTGKWSGGTGSFSNPNLLNAIYTPGAGETTATLTLTSTAPPGPCGPKSDNVIITIKAGPPAPTAQGTALCSGSVATLSATAPGGIYQWYDAPAGGNLLATGATFTTPALIASTTYYVETNMAGTTSSRTPVIVKVNVAPAAPVAPTAQICTGSPATLTASGSAGTYQWYDSPTGGNLLSANATYVTPALTTNTSYYVETTVNGCTSARTQAAVTVTPMPIITSASTATVCSGSPLGYTITADVPTATFLWSRAQTAGISNPAVTNQTSPTIIETLIVTGNSAVNVTYVITPMSGTCSGKPFNLVVTVYPTPVITGKTTATICDITTDNYAVTFSTPATSFSWSRAAVAGISNAAVAGQTATTIKEVLFNTSNAPVDVTYNFTYGTSTCTGAPFSLVITVNPNATINSPAIGTACSGVPQAYVITSNIPTATYIWSRAAVKGISNPTIANQATGIINETLINTSTQPVFVVYDIIPVTNGCSGIPTKYTVTVNPSVAKPVANGNSPVCTGNAINLRTAPVANASYLWTGPNGYTSALQNPDITNVTTANTGTYTLVVSVNGCDSPPATVAIVVDAPPLADAGPDQLVCIANPSVFLAGKVSGGTTTGIWTTAGTGLFSPSVSTLNAQYLPSAADKAAGAVVLTLTSTSKDNCNISTSTMTVRFGPLPAVNAGGDQSVCSQVSSVQLNGKTVIPGGVKWTSSGTGTFSPSDTQLGASYMPSAADAKKGSVMLTLHAINPGACYIPSDSLSVTFIPPATVNAGGLRYVLKDRDITLNPVVSEANVHYLWSPNVGISNDTLKNPVITGDIDRTYTLTVTDSRGCVSQDTTNIKVSPPIKTDNTFTPNGDGINDYWDVTGLIAYVDATVDIFNRYGQKVFHSLGYPRPWDGNYNGHPLPVGTYYYLINTNYNGLVLSGYVTIIR